MLPAQVESLWAEDGDFETCQIAAACPLDQSGFFPSE
jgi:hypothetical protein